MPNELISQILYLLLTGFGRGLGTGVVAMMAKGKR